MLTPEVKKHIDAARQVLVGVVPNPTSQIDQITNALIYKFMDDMDQAAIKQGGDPSFFVDDLEKYAWTKLMSTRLTNQERMNLYSEALINFSESKQLPPLFRDIFRSAFLPYRDPAVLDLFLKEISYFDYSHSEELGNAYEYLLSIMSSQGDAGQFRTPRHIIDFIVAVVNPSKDDKILDPACGTAGFLISAYKHIIAQHDGKESDGTPNNERPLSPDDRRNILKNFEGYDVDPGMVRISKVNMYLHHFKDPKIFGYNTLASDERWNDKFDVILANPPFMSPKGGVTVHNKFSIESSRSEVLFVDYIMSHLRPKGRAGIIVPEGVIFQSGNAYKQLRKQLVEDGLWAVVSLPSGVFNPYAGVKTSVLLFNNELSKQSDELLLVKISNDGFDLGATKRPISKNDLPEALNILSAWKRGEKTESPIATYAAKSKIAETGDYNLSGDRYRMVIDNSNATWPTIKLGEVCDVRDGTHESPAQVQTGYPLVTSKNIKDGHLDLSDVSYISEDDFKKISQRSYVDIGDIIMPMIGTIGGACLVRSKEKEFAIKNVALFKKSERIIPEYLCDVLRSEQVASMFASRSAGSTQKFVSLGVLRDLKIPLPPLEIQEQIVSELDGYNKIIDGANQIIANWKPKIDIDQEWPKGKLDAVCDVISSKRIFQEEYVASGIPFYRTKEIVELSQKKEISQELFISEKRYEEIKNNSSVPKKGDILISAVGTIGVSWAVSDNRKFYFKDGNLIWLRNFKNVETSFVKLMLDIAVANNLHLLTNGAAYNALTIIKLKDLEIPLPPIELQKQIVDKIEAERELVSSNKKLIDIYERKIKEILDKLWSRQE